MLGQALIKEGRRRDLDLVGVSRHSKELVVDLGDDKSLARCLDKTKAQVIVNTVAVITPDSCERDPCTAYRINARLPAVLANEARRVGAYLIHVSTDHFFSGDGLKKHGEQHPIQLLNEYARTKYAGECFVLTCEGSLVLRTNIVGFRGRGAPTFVEWVLSSLETRRPMTLFDDFFASSLDVGAFSSALFDLLPKNISGILNVASSEVACKKRFVEILASKLGFDCSNCTSGSVRSLTLAHRAESLGLDVSRAESLLGRPLPGLEEVLDNLVREYKERGPCATTA
jgi:dTDP-4-dehydrorhamnose reductase